LFGLSKFHLQAHQNFHQKQDAIKAHVLIRFVELMAEKYVELITNLSMRKIRVLL